MIRHLLAVCVALAALMSAAPARAAIDTDCLIAIKSKSGWSREHKAKVVFVTGVELSRVSGSLPVDVKHHYVVILHEHSLPTVARLDNPLPGVQREFTARDLARLYAINHEPMATQIAGEGMNLKWRLRGRNAKGWVDEDFAFFLSVLKN